MIRSFQRVTSVYNTLYRFRRHKENNSPQLRRQITVATTAAMSGTIKPRALDYANGPLVWVDCEMTGLDYRKDKILEIAVIITDGDLEPVDDGIEYIIKTEKEVLDSMGEWCVKQHGESGLTDACLKSPHSLSSVSDAVLNYIKERIPQHRIGVLAGNSVHMDRNFMAESMPGVIDWLHYRIVDVSSIKELKRRWYPELTPPKAEDANDAHRALADIRRSIEGEPNSVFSFSWSAEKMHQLELRWYRGNIFVPSGRPPSNNDMTIETRIDTTKL